jgi:hypothetical protein
MFGSSGFFTSREFLTPDQLNRESCSGPRAAFTMKVLSDSLFQLVSAPGVARPISATEDVCKERFEHCVG